MANFLQICQSVAEEVGVEVPGSIFNNTSETAIRLKATGMRAIDSVAKCHDWKVMIREYTITLVASQADYALPSDFDRFIHSTHWNRNDAWALQGPASPQDWQRLKSGLVQSSVRQRWRLKYDATAVGNRIFIDPTPGTSDAGEVLALEYVSFVVATNAAGTIRTAANVGVDTDILLLDDYILKLDQTWRMLKRMGVPYIEEKKEAEDEISRAKARDGGNQILNIGATTVISSLDAGVPEVGFGT